VPRNPGDWSAEDLFEQLAAFEAVNARFARFLEGLASSDVIPDEPAQRGIVAIVNPHLRAVGAELRETGADRGYPVFRVVPAGSARSPDLVSGVRSEQVANQAIRDYLQAVHLTVERAAGLRHSRLGQCRAGRG
jgi:AbiJ N-terminal domain 3